MESTPISGKPIIAITMGDPCGVGPEILVKAMAAASGEAGSFVPLIIGDPLALQRANDLLGAHLEFQPVGTAAEIPRLERGIPLLTPRDLSLDDMTYGDPSENACRAVIEYIETAVDLAMRGEVRAICTCPIHKANLQRHGYRFPGHTEFLQHLTGADKVIMMLAGPRLKVSLATIHTPLAEVPALLTGQLLADTIRITAEALLRDFALERPHIAIAGLNPHAGEQGRFGKEELELISPAMESFVGERFKISGPYPADTLFHRAYHGEFDAVVAMYHDQGLIPVKLVHFQEAVNLTLGLPIIRTSVDHGTAYDLAGTGRADHGSLSAAIQLAVFLARNRFGLCDP